jgi:hypothetical protein
MNVHVTPEPSTTKRVYDWIVEQPTGILFTSREAAKATGVTHKNAASAIAHLVKRGMLVHKAKKRLVRQARGRGGGTGFEFVYEYVSHEEIRFQRPKFNPGHHGPRHCEHMTQVPYLDGYVPGTRNNLNGHAVRALAAPPAKPPLSDRLLEFAIDLDERRKARVRALVRRRKGKRTRVPAIASPAMVERLLELAAEVAALERKPELTCTDGSGI